MCKAFINIHVQHVTSQMLPNYIHAVKSSISVDNEKELH